MRFERARCLLARERLDDDNRVIRIVSLIDRVHCFRAGCRFDAGKLARCSIIVKFLEVIPTIQL